MGEEDQRRRLMRTPKEETAGERILGPTRRPDGTLRKPIRIRAGYVPQDEVAIYQSKGVLLREVQPNVPPGFDAEAVWESNKPKSKSAKRNERKKENKLKVALASSDDKAKDLDSELSRKLKTKDTPFAEKQHILETVETVTNQISNLSVSSTSAVASASTDKIEASKCEDTGPDIDRRIRALKKKIRLAEVQLNGDQKTMKPEQLEKMAKVEGWREELQVLEDKKATMVS